MVVLTAMQSAYFRLKNRERIEVTMDNYTIEIPARWWHIALIFAGSIILVLTGAFVVYTLMLK
jgi:hypothetical protein